MNDRVTQDLAMIARNAIDYIIQLERERSELLEALKLARSIIGHPDDAHTQFINAAIAKAEGEAP